MRHATASLLALAAAAAALAACGQPFLSVRVETPEIRIVRPPEDFPALPVDPESVCSIIAVPDCTARTIPLDLGENLDQDGVTTELRLTGFALHFTGGDARGVRGAEVDLLDPDTGATTMVARYVRTSTDVPLRDVVAETSNVELSQFLKAGALEARVEVLLDPAYLPTGFTASVEATFSAKITVDYKEFL